MGPLCIPESHNVNLVILKISLKFASNRVLEIMMRRLYTHKCNPSFKSMQLIRSLNICVILQPSKSAIVMCGVREWVENFIKIIIFANSTKEELIWKFTLIKSEGKREKIHLDIAAGKTACRGKSIVRHGCPQSIYRCSIIP